MDAIEEIEQKLLNYENQYVSENKLLVEKVNEFMEREQNYKDQILSLFNQVNELKLITTNHNKKSELDAKLIKEENIQLKEEYNSIKTEYNKLKKELNSEKMKNEMLLDKYNKLSYLYDQKEKENLQLIEKNKNKKDIIELDKKEEELQEKNEQLIYCNNTLSIFVKWIKTNLITLNNINNDYNSYNDYINNEKNDLFIFEELKDSLLKAKNILDNKFTKINKELENQRQQLINIQNENYELNNILENIYNHLYQEICNEKFFDINDNDVMNNRIRIDIYYYCNEIENMLNKTFELLKKIKESSYNKSLDKLIEDNTQLPYMKILTQK